MGLQFNQQRIDCCGLNLLGWDPVKPLIVRGLGHFNIHITHQVGQENNQRFLPDLSFFFADDRVLSSEAQGIIDFDVVDGN